MRSQFGYPTSASDPHEHLSEAIGDLGLDRKLRRRYREKGTLHDRRFTAV